VQLEARKISPISTGSLKLDLALPSEGLLPGEMVILHGPFESGKTSLCLSLMSQVAQAGKSVVFFDLDNSLEFQFPTQLGFSSESIFLVKDQMLEAAVDIARSLLYSNSTGMVVFDSITTPDDESEVTPYEKKLAAILPTLVREARTFGSILVLTQRSLYHSGPAYHALSKHLFRLSPFLHADHRFELEPVQYIIKDKTVSGLRLEIKAIHGKIRRTRFPIDINIMYNQGVRRINDIFELGLDWQTIRLQNQNFFFKDIHLGHSQDETETFLEENHDVALEVEKEIRRIRYTEQI
jgi:recombination protein RecA